MQTRKPMSRDLSHDKAFTNRVDRVAASGCFVLSALIVATCLRGIIDLVQGCSDPRHGCAYFIVGLPLFVVIAFLCAGAGYWLWPNYHGESDESLSEQPSEGR